MIQHQELNPAQLHRFIRKGRINFAGNKRLKIYGVLNCRSGKRIKKENRVFFQWEAEAVKNNFRPCGCCMRQEYLKWKKLHFRKSALIPSATTRTKSFPLTKPFPHSAS